MGLLEKIKKDFPFKVKIGDKTIKYRPWNTKEEKNYLLVSGSKENPTFEDIENILLTNCVENYDEIKKDLTEGEKYLLLLEIRKFSISETIDLKFECVKCKKLNDLAAPLDKIVHYKEANYKEVKLDNKVFYFGKPKTEKLVERVREEKDPIEKEFKNLLIHIQKIEIDDEVFDSFTFEELYEFVSNLPAKEFDELSKEFNGMKEEFDVYLDTYCMFCNAENKVVFGGIEDFLWG